MSRSCCYSLVPWVAFLCCSVGQIGQAADLKMRIVWQGDLPVLPRIENPFEKDCEEVDLNAGRQFVDASSKGVRDAVVYVAPSRRDRDRWRQPQRKQTVRVEVKDCRIQPHIVVAQAGDKLTIAQKDEAAIHNLNLSFFMNAPVGLYQPVDGEQTRELTRAEPAAVPIKCNVHPWMKAFLFVLDHSYIGVSDVKGELILRGLPDATDDISETDGTDKTDETGETDVPLRFFHPHGQIYSVQMNGERKPLHRGRMSVRLKGSVTDLGLIVIDAQSFKSPESEKNQALPEAQKS